MGEGGGSDERGLMVRPEAEAAMEPVMVQTPGGRIEVNWEPEASATAQAQLAFFAEFLAISGVYQEWVRTCPLHYSSNNASEVADVLGTWFLSILAGHCRYAHVTGLRGDQASRQILGMKKMVSEDALRRALARIGEQASAHWLKPRLLASAGPVLDRPWILDIDTTIKTLYGKQQGAEVSYNPHKPGRPSHTLHTYFVADLRLVLDAVVHSGKQHAAHYTLPGLVELLDGLAPHLRPALVRGDCGFGNEPVIGELEKRGQSYLFKLRQTEGVKRLLRRQFARQDWTRPGAGDQGWSAIEDTLQLTGWERARRVVILRRKARTQVALTRQTEEAQIELLLPSTDVEVWEYAVLVADCPYPLESVAQLYRDRADAENAFDELKNQWGWGGFTTRDMSRCQTAARAVALVYNWWSWYCRAAKPEARMEAATSRPLLLAAVGRLTRHAGKTRLQMTPLHGCRAMLMLLIANIRAAITHVRRIAEQSPGINRWKTLLDYIGARILPRTTATRLLLNPT